MTTKYSPAEHPNGYRLRYTDTQTKTSGIAYSLNADQILKTRDDLGDQYSWIFERGREGDWRILESYGPDLKTLLSA